MNPNAGRPLGLTPAMNRKSLEQVHWHQRRVVRANLRSLFFAVADRVQTSQRGTRNTCVAEIRACRPRIHIESESARHRVTAGRVIGPLARAMVPNREAEYRMGGVRRVHERTRGTARFTARFCPVASGKDSRENCRTRRTPDHRLFAEFSVREGYRSQGASCRSSTIEPRRGVHLLIL